MNKSEILLKEPIFRLLNEKPKEETIRLNEANKKGFIELDFNPYSLKQEKTYCFYTEKWFKEQLKTIQFQFDLSLFQNKDNPEILNEIS